MKKLKPLFKKMNRTAAVFLIGLLFVLAAGLVFFAFIYNSLPSPDQFANRKVNQSTKIFDRTGQVLLYEIHGEEKRTIIPFDAIPDVVKKATLAAEDANFYTHPAFSWKSILRAIFVNLLQGKVTQGGSTITQQLAKNAFFSSERTLTRKIKELLVAIELEKKYSKDEILDLYLNQIPYGNNAYGIEAASQTFFGKSAKDLNLAEAALLASLPKATSYYSPYGSHLNELMDRRNYVLDQMISLGYISKSQYNEAKNFKYVFAPQASGIKAPHFSLMVQDYLNSKYGDGFAESAGLSVITTLDWDLQQLAEKSVLDGANSNTTLYNGHNAALVAQDATTGQILALVGSKNYFGTPEPDNCTPGKDCLFEGNFNVATQGLRQPGSAMKPFAYLTAFEKGFTPDTVLFDVPTEFAANNPACPATVDFSNDNKDCFHPQNFDEKFRGPISLRNALAQSVNVPSVKTLYLAGIDDTLKTAQDFGITTLTERSRYGLSLVLGGGEVKLADLVGAYSVFAQEGIKHQQSFILKITDSQGKTLEEYQDKAQQIVDPQYPRLIDNILSDGQARSPLFQNSFNLTVYPGHQVALKTGTTNDYRDAWAIGFTPDLVVGVWAGNNDNEPMQRHGSSILAAVPIWNAFLKAALQNRSLIAFNNPDPVFPKKAVLKGQSTVNYQIGDKTYPQVHSILYYVDKNNPNGPAPQDPSQDPQFKNWEFSVLNWAQNNLPNFSTFNQPLPPGLSESDTGSASQTTINFISPKNGDFLKGNSVAVQIQISSQFPIKNLELDLNNSAIDKKSGDYGLNFIYQYNLSTANINLQNSLKLKITDSLGNQTEKEIILFK